MATIVYTATAARAMIRPANRAKLIKAKIVQYAENRAAQARNVKPLVGVDARRSRVQDFRVLFRETAHTITILDIGPRGGIYD